MPRAQQNKVFNTFVKGLITEAGPLTFPENASTDEENCDLFAQGNRRRRIGANLEDNFILSTQTVALTTWDDYAISSHQWDTVGGDGNTNFLVLQIGDTLYFYDLSAIPLSGGQKAFTIDLTIFTATGATEVEKSVVQVVNGKGLIFVSGSKIESFFVEYTNSIDTIISTQINIEVRDFEGLDDSLANDEEPVTLSDEHNYNLKNQGWIPPNDGGTNPITTYFTSQSKYPPNSKQWWTGKNSTNDFDPLTLTKFMVGNTLSPKGHLVLKAFFKDRSIESGIPGLETESVTGRPSATSFFAGRVWWAGVSGSKFNGNIYFNQILEGTTNIGRCYQINDPTSEDLNSLLSSDGGIIVIPEIGSVLKLFAMQDALVILADNGVWSISGPDGVFKATDFTVSKISSIGVDSAESVVDVEGTPVWWGKTGINTVIQNEVTFKFGVTNISKDTIQGFYDDIPALSKVDAKGIYDQATKKIFWLYRSIANIDNLDRYRFDKILVLDTRLGAFYPWKIETFSTVPYYIGSVFTTSSLNSADQTFNIVDGIDNVLDGADQVVFADKLIIGSDTFVKFFVFTEGLTNVQWSFGGFTSTRFKDWFSVDSVGVDYLSFFETGDEMMGDVQRDKQSTYIHVLFNRTETSYVDGSFETWVRPSGCFMQAKWEWSDSANSSKFSPKVQVYRFQRRINGIVKDGLDIVVDGVDQVFVSNTYIPSSGTDFDSGFPVTITKNKVRGVGKALRLRFESESGKDFDLLGWAINFSGVTQI